jgi:hypothetical protein
MSLITITNLRMMKKKQVIVEFLKLQKLYNKKVDKAREYMNHLNNKYYATEEGRLRVRASQARYYQKNKDKINQKAKMKRLMIKNKNNM